jgi:hypothetical protein
MIDAAAYRANETNAKRAIASWRLSNVNDPYIFQNQGFPVRADSFLDLAQILDTMQEGRFDYYMKELGGFTEEDHRFFIRVCLDYINFYCSFFQRGQVVVALSTLISHFVIYKKLLGYQPGFQRVLEIGPGCGYLSFFLREHEALADYTQIESTESFYLLQSHINSHVFGSRFTEHALSRQALDDHAVYVPKLNWHNPFHYEDQKVINVETPVVCNHYPWWRIADVAQRRYDIVTSNANLNEFSREALFQYLSLIREVLADDGAIVAQCLGGGPPSYDTIFAHMKSAGFVPVALVQIDNVPGRLFVVSNGVFVGERHPLYQKYSAANPQFPTLDRSLDFVNKMYFLNEEQADRKTIYSPADMLEAIVERVGSLRRPDHHAPVAVPRQLSSDVNRLRKVALLQTRADVREVSVSHVREEAASASNYRAEMERLRFVNEIETLKKELYALRSSRSWRITEPLRAFGRWVRWRFPNALRLLRWIRTRA